MSTAAPAKLAGGGVWQHRLLAGVADRCGNIGEHPLLAGLVEVCGTTSVVIKPTPPLVRGGVLPPISIFRFRDPKTPPLTRGGVGKISLSEGGCARGEVKISAA